MTPQDYSDKIENEIDNMGARDNADANVSAFIASLVTDRYAENVVGRLFDGKPRGQLTRLGNLWKIASDLCSSVPGAIPGMGMGANVVEAYDRGPPPESDLEKVYDDIIAATISGGMNLNVFTTSAVHARRSYVENLVSGLLDNRPRSALRQMGNWWKIANYYCLGARYLNNRQVRDFREDLPITGGLDSDKMAAAYAVGSGLAPFLTAAREVVHASANSNDARIVKVNANALETFSHAAKVAADSATPLQPESVIAVLGQEFRIVGMAAVPELIREAFLVDSAPH